MENYKISISASAEKSLKKVPKKDLIRLVELIYSLSVQPTPIGSRKLMGEEFIYRVRSGNYRVVYELRKHELVILVLKLGHRKDVYRK